MMGIWRRKKRKRNEYGQGRARERIRNIWYHGDGVAFALHIIVVIA
jgi:hypothetical protein